MLTSSSTGVQGGLDTSLVDLCTPGQDSEEVPRCKSLPARVAALRLRLRARRGTCFGFQSLMPASAPASWLTASRLTDTVLQYMHVC